MTFARMGIYDDKLYMVIVREVVPDLPEKERGRLASMTNQHGPMSSSSSTAALKSSSQYFHQTTY
jgi:hypothetical protein